MKTVLKVVSGFFLVLAFAACNTSVSGRGEMATHEFTTADFDKVEFQLPAKLIVHQRDAKRVSVRTHANIIDLVEAKVKGSRLVISFAEGYSLRKFDTLNVVVEMPQIKAIDVSGSGDVVLPEPVSGGEMALKVTGSGNLMANGIAAVSLLCDIGGSGDITVDSIHTPLVRTVIAGSGNIKANGSAEKQVAEINGSGDINTKHLMVKDCNVVLNGSGNVHVSPAGTLKVRINGSGDVCYYSHPAEMDSKVNGSGSVRFNQK